MTSLFLAAGVALLASLVLTPLLIRWLVAHEVGQPIREDGPRGHITKAGPRELRSLLVQAAWVCWRRAKTSGTLKTWTEHLAARRGRRIAVVALARRLSRILYALWRDETEFSAATLAA